MSIKRPLIFISYARSDLIIAEALTRSFEQKGYPVWLDYKTIPSGSNWQSEIENALSQADIFVVVLSSKAASSQWVNAELGFALGQKKPIIPILIEDVSL